MSITEGAYLHVDDIKLFDYSYVRSIYCFRTGDFTEIQFQVRMGIGFISNKGNLLCFSLLFAVAQDGVG